MSPSTKRIVRRAAFGLAGAGAVGILVLGALNPGSVARTSIDSPDPRLLTRRYSGPIATVRDVVRDIVPGLKTYGRSWQIVEAEGSGNTDSPMLTIRAKVPVVVFTDDFEIVLRQEEDIIVVDVHSQSRVGKGDFGENRRHIIQFLSELDRRMAK